MRISIQTLGTRGDVQPYLALAIGLRDAGHEVQLAAPTQFEAFVGQRGINFAHLPGEFLDLMEAPEAKAAIAGGSGFSAGFKLLNKFKPIVRRLLSAQWKAAKAYQPELVIYHPKAVGAPHIAEKLGCPAILASPLPGFTPTTAFASPLVPFKSVGPFNRMSHSVMAASGDFIFSPMIAEWRVTELGLSKRPTRPLKPALTLYAYSSSVLPKPADWNGDAIVTGYWFLDDDSDWTPPADLAAFLAAGDAPVYVGFGSMPGLGPRRITDIIIEGLARACRRGILSTGEGALVGGNKAAHVHFIDNAPHDKLFPLVTACVHHGGAGTTAASLRAGKPTVICPFFGDQPFWGRRVCELGAGPPPLDRKTLSAESLERAIEATADPAMSVAAQRLGASIEAEDGVENAIEAIERRLVLRKAS